jgi:hypothetical protein
MKTAKQLTYLAAISAGEMERAIALFADDGWFGVGCNRKLEFRYRVHA